jgi:beta-lactamase class A
MAINFSKEQFKVFLLSALFLLAGPFAQAQKTFRTDKKLTQKLEKAITGFHGDVGIFVHNLKTGKGAAINADTLFPTASTIKVPIMCALFDKIVKGELQYHQKLVYHDSIAYGGSGIMQYFKDSTKIDLSVAVTLMITRSDNTAALWCQSLAGGGTVINQWLSSHGFQNTRVNSRTPGRHKIWEIYGWGQTTPREMATLVTEIYKNKILNPAACERMYRNMTHIYWDNNALSQIPPYIQTASKSGAVNAARSEVVLVNAPHGDYVFAIYTKNNKDQSWTSQNEAVRLIRKVSALLWQYYEPRSRWEPAEGIKKYWGDE